MSASESSRRVFLHVLGGSAGLGVASLCGLGCSNATGGNGPAGTISAGNVSDVAVGSIAAVDGMSVAIARDEGGLYAMTLICTHQDCDMQYDGTVTPDGLTCTCHGSEFDVNGAVTRGPAVTALEHYEVTVDSAGEITINADQVVDASTRTAV